jgi:hypothetical protein
MPSGNGGVRMAHSRHVQKYPIISGFVTPISSPQPVHHATVFMAIYRPFRLAYGS